MLGAMLLCPTRALGAVDVRVSLRGAAAALRASAMPRLLSALRVFAALTDSGL